MLDPISDMITRIKNAQRVGGADVLIPSSNLKMAIAKILEKKEYVSGMEKEKQGSRSFIRLGLKYDKVAVNKELPAISDIKRVSKEGRRKYVSKTDIRKTKQGYGISIISTSRGVMTGEEAYKKGIGGELICEVW